MPLGCSPLESNSCNLQKSCKMNFQRALAKQQLSTATLSYSPTFIIGVMSTGPLISGCALAHSRPTNEARLRDRIRVADHPEVK